MTATLCARALSLDVPIKLESQTETDQLLELHHNYKQKVRTLAAELGIPYDDRLDSADQLWRMVLALAEKQFAGFAIEDEPRDLREAYKRLVAFTSL